MLAEVCRCYHWTLEYCLKMPARQFFLMLEEARKLRSVEYMNECRIAAIPMCNSKYFEETISSFKYMAKEKKQDVLPDQKRALKAESKSAKYAVMGMFASIKRH